MQFVLVVLCVLHYVFLFVASPVCSVFYWLLCSMLVWCWRFVFYAWSMVCMHFCVICGLLICGVLYLCVVVVFMRFSVVYMFCCFDYVLLYLPVCMCLCADGLFLCVCDCV